MPKRRKWPQARVEALRHSWSCGISNRMPPSRIFVLAQTKRCPSSSEGLRRHQQCAPHPGQWSVFRRLVMPRHAYDLNIGIRAIPFKDVAVVVADRLYTEQEPPIVSVVPAQACFNLARLAGSQQAPPKIHQPVSVFCVNGRSPAQSMLLPPRGRCNPASAIEEFSRAVWTSGPRQGRNGVNVLCCRACSVFGSQMAFPNYSSIAHFKTLRDLRLD